jgi:hypothetical protein
MPSIALSMAGTRPEESGLASGLANVSLQFGAALGVALVAGISSSTAVHQVLSGVAPQAALLDGFHEGFLVAAAVVAFAVASVGLLLRPGQVSAERVPAVPVFSRPRLALPSAPAIRISQAHLEQAPAADGSILRDLDREEVRVA